MNSSFPTLIWNVTAIWNVTSDILHTTLLPFGGDTTDYICYGLSNNSSLISNNILLSFGGDPQDHTPHSGSLLLWFSEKLKEIHLILDNFITTYQMLRLYYQAKSESCLYSLSFGYSYQERRYSSTEYRQ